jgi:hypothetical protein
LFGFGLSDLCRNILFQLFSLRRGHRNEMNRQTPYLNAAINGVVFAGIELVSFA